MRRTRKVEGNTEYGHSVTMSVRVSPAVAHAISLLVNSDLWDFHNNNGFLQTALQNLLDRCEDEEPGIGAWHYVQLVENEIRLKEEQLRFGKIISSLRDQCNEMADAGEWDDMRKHLENIMATINSHPEGSRKQKYLEYMRECTVRLEGLAPVQLQAGLAQLNGTGRGMTFEGVED